MHTTEELFYNQARLVGIYLCQKALRAPTRTIIGLGISQDSKEQFVHLMMNLLTHRHQVNDGNVVKDLALLLVDSDIDPALQPRSSDMWKWAQIKRDFGSSVKSSFQVVEVLV